jgi:membrane protein implicated in regulation of membrane protease activity
MLRPYQLLITKGWLGATGLAVGLLGMATEVHWLVWIAVGLLAVAFLLRFAGRKPLGPENGENQ